MALTKADRRIKSLSTMKDNLAMSIRDKDATIKSMKKSIKGMKLEKRASRAMHTATAIGGGAIAGAAEGVMGNDSTITLFDIEVPVVGLAALAGRVGAEFIDPDSDGAGFLAGLSDGALAYSAGTMAKPLVQKWTA